MSDHLPVELLELYILNRVSPEQAEAIEEHLLICEVCREKLTETTEFVAAIRIGLQRVTGIIAIHATDEGQVTLFVEPQNHEWLARIRGASIDAGQIVPAHAEGVAWCRRTFAEMFPGHVCGGGCTLFAAHGSG